MILGLGSDITDCSRIGNLIRKHGDSFRSRFLTDSEAAEEDGISYIAGRWCAKEALSKALGTGIGVHCAFRDIEILRDPESGRPVMSLSGNAKKTADALGVKRIHLSISHERLYAIATVILED